MLLTFDLDEVRIQITRLSIRNYQQTLQRKLMGTNLVTFLNVTNHFSCCRVDGWECLS